MENAIFNTKHPKFKPYTLTLYNDTCYNKAKSTNRRPLIILHKQQDAWKIDKQIQWYCSQVNSKINYTNQNLAFALLLNHARFLTNENNFKIFQTNLTERLSSEAIGDVRDVICIIWVQTSTLQFSIYAWLAWNLIEIQCIHYPRCNTVSRQDIFKMTLFNVKWWWWWHNPWVRVPFDSRTL